MFTHWRSPSAASRQDAVRKTQSLAWLKKSLEFVSVELILNKTNKRKVVEIRSIYCCVMHWFVPSESFDHFHSTLNRNECSFIVTNPDVTLLFVRETNEQV